MVQVRALVQCSADRGIALWRVTTGVLMCEEGRGPILLYLKARKLQKEVCFLLERERERLIPLGVVVVGPP